MSAIPETSPRWSATLALRREVAQRVLRGASADDAEIIEPSRLRREQRAALWLYAWSMMDPSEQRRTALDYIERVAD